ncbi:MAG: GNAT family N-acetyltransferase [Pseudomonadota bacterium]
MLTQAKSEDEAALERLIETAFVKYVQALGRDWPGPYPWLPEAIAQGRVLWIDGTKGCAVIDRDGDALKIDQIAIDPAHQGRGTGRRAMEALEELAIRASFAQITLYTAQVHTNLVAFYSSLGYRVTDLRPPASGKDDIPRIHMTKPLN